MSLYDNANCVPVPLGVIPYGLWRELANFSPSLTQYLERYTAVSDAIARFRAAGLPPRRAWICEIGICYVDSDAWNAAVD